MNRRNFLKALGIGGSASALQACNWDYNRYYTPIENILPYVVKPEGVTPGTPTFFATTVTRGPEAYSVLAKHRDGRVIHLAANKELGHLPAIPKSALFELQKHYSPDRFKGPQAGGNSGESVTWDAATAQVVDAAKKAKASGKKVAWLGGYRSGTMLKLIKSICDTSVFWEPLGYEAEANAAEALFGQRSLPSYNLAGATYVLSFGADFLNHWGGAASQIGFSQARNHTDATNADKPGASHGHVARFALVSPYRDQTGANADDWYAAKPGSQAMVARAVASLVAKKTNATGKAVEALGTVDVAAAAAAAGLEASDIQAMADQFVANKSVALPGGANGAGKDATELAAAVFLLNIVGGSAGTLFNGNGYRGPISSTKDLEGLLADLDAGRIGVLFVDDTNPVYALPGKGVAASIAKADLSVAFTSHPDETTDACKLVLPSADAFEDWGDEEPAIGVMLLRQPSMSPLAGWDTRSAGEVMVATARALGVTTQEDWKGYIRHRWAKEVYDQLKVLPELRSKLETAQGAEKRELEEKIANRPDLTGTDGFKTFFDDSLRTGFFVHGHGTRYVPTVTGNIPWQGSAEPAGSGAYYLHIAPHAHLYDGRFANTPWAQEVPDPMTGQVWDSWVEVHPETAAQLGASDNTALTLTTEAGNITVGVEVTKSVRPDTLAIQFGQGHTASGRYAEGVGQNAASLVKYMLDPHGAMAWQGYKVAVAVAGSADLISTFGGDSDEDRNFAAKVNAKQFDAKGDGPTDHPGDLTGIHHLELDKRLTDAGLTDFYGLSQHPTYRFGMTVDTDLCNGCGACSVACYAENNLPVVGKHKVKQGREMGWVRVNRYFKGDDTYFVPMMCQHCGHAPCESVCPVLATYHNLDGLNAMVYNRCVGTRYCSNACPYSARKFNYHSYAWPEPFNMQLNPDVVVRTMGVMEKCTFCVQRIRAVKSAYKDVAATNPDFTAVVPDEALKQLPACAEACPSQALTFGNLNDAKSGPTMLRKSPRHYEPLADLNVFPAINYLAKVSFHAEEVQSHHGGGHGGGDHADGDHAGGEKGGAHAAPHHDDKSHDAKSHDTKPAHAEPKPH